MVKFSNKSKKWLTRKLDRYSLCYQVVNVTKIPAELRSAGILVTIKNGLLYFALPFPVKGACKGDLAFIRIYYCNFAHCHFYNSGCIAKFV